MEKEELTWPWWPADTKEAVLMYQCITVSMYQCITVSLYPPPEETTRGRLQGTYRFVYFTSEIVLKQRKTVGPWNNPETSFPDFKGC